MKKHLHNLIFQAIIDFGLDREDFITKNKRNPSLSESADLIDKIIDAKSKVYKVSLK